MKKLLPLLIWLLTLSAGMAQFPFDDDREVTTSFLNSRGIMFATTDSLYSLNLRFRMQNRFAYTTRSLQDLKLSSSEMLIRRLRLRLNGHLGSKRLTYAIQLGFTVEDMDGDVNELSNIIRDAIAEYKLNEKWSIGFGQTKLPGNRERVNSSSDLQLVDRSLMNRTFNIDRDFGTFLRYRTLLGKTQLNLIGVISSGQGRNVRIQSEGYCYTGRVEWLPMGSFTGGGDYFQGDIMRESKPKLSLGLASSFNRNANRSGAQIGSALPQMVDLYTHFSDIFFKYKGLSLAGEGVYRTWGENGKTLPRGTVYNGYGYCAQLSYCTAKHWEGVGRVSQIIPIGSSAQILQGRREITLGINRYLRYHRVKLQSDISLLTAFKNEAAPLSEKWGFRFQIEVGI
jgi:phosphate-selective porin OprO and OprP